MKTKFQLYHTTRKKFEQWFNLSYHNLTVLTWFVVGLVFALDCRLTRIARHIPWHTSIPSRTQRLWRFIKNPKIDALFLAKQLKAYPYKISFTVQELIPNQQGEVITAELTNPFANYSNLLRHLKWIATDAPIDQLREFADCGNQSLTDWGSNYSRYAIYLLQIASGEAMSDWFDAGLNELLREDDFFSPCFHNNAYHNLDWYAIGRCEIRVLQEIPEYAYYIQHLWFWEDLVEVYYNIGGCMHRVIADAYRLKGWRWFAYNAESDPILFRWAMLGSLSLKKMGNDQERQITKNDLLDIYENMLLAFGTRSDNAIVDGLLPEIRDAIISFDDDAIERMTKEMSSLKEENLRLTNDKAKLEKMVAELKKQIKHIQKSAIPHIGDQEAETVEKIERILQRVYSFTNPIPELENVSSKILNLNRIWDNLSEETRKDIVSSIILFEQNIAVDIAILPLLKSLEREFTRHIFQPFMRYPGFDGLKRSICSNPRYSNTHSVLSMRNGVFPTLGSIPYIGRAVHDKKAQNSSELISLFSIFIGPVMEEFRSICNDLDRYRLGIDNARIVDLRNAIAHGKEEITKHVDSKIFEAILRVLYCPPLELIVRVVRISRGTKK